MEHKPNTREQSKEHIIACSKHLVNPSLISTTKVMKIDKEMESKKVGEEKSWRLIKGDMKGGGGIWKDSTGEIREEQSKILRFKGK